MKYSSGIQLPEVTAPLPQEIEAVAGISSCPATRGPDGHQAPETRRSRGSSAQDVLRQSIRNADGPQSIRNAVASFLKQHPQVVYAVWYQEAQPGIGTQDVMEGLLAPESGLPAPVMAALKAAVRSACQRDGMVLETLPPGTLQIAAVPLGGQYREVIAVIAECHPSADADVRLLVSQLEWMTALIAENRASRVSDESRRLASACAAIADLISRIQATADPESGARALADSLQNHLQPGEVRVGLCDRGSHECRLVAMSGGRVIDRLSVETRETETVMQEALLRGQPGTWPVRNPDNGHALLAHRQLAEQQNCQSLLSIPLRSEDGSAVGCVLLLFSGPSRPETSPDGHWQTPEDRVPAAERFLSAASGPLASTLSLLQSSAEFRWLRWLSRLRTVWTRSHLQNGLIISAAAAILLLLPVTYKVSGAVELQPASRRFVAAPFDASLAECFVEPGDYVRQNQLLVRLDGREIRVELAEATASLNKAVRERNAQAARHEYGAASITAEEISRLEQQIELLKLREAGLEIRSPAEGVVVSGDHREACGIPLKTGQTLFEIAPLNQMVIELSIPEDDLQYVQPGMPLSVQPDAFPGRRLNARVRRIHPSAVIRDHENVFIAEADLENVDGLLRPGMRGTGWISTRRHFWGWNLLHKPLGRIRGWLGW